MRKYFQLLMLSALILGVSACTNEGMEPEVDSTTAAMSFTFRTGNNPLVTRVIGDEAAGEFDLNSVDIYAFDSNSGALVGKLVPGTDITTTTGAGTLNYAATPAWLRANSGRTLNFYFVANDATSTNGAHMPAVTPATESAFVELITNQLTDTDTDGYYDNIATPLLFSTSAKNVQLVGKIQKDVLLYRRVARFDIVNDHYATFQVNKIMVSNAVTKGYIFGDATGVNNPLPQASLEEITGPAQSDYAVVDGEYLAPHVFYLYPTTVGLMEDDATNTEIVINATIGGQTKNYIVPTEIDILANKRYKLVLDPVSLTFSIVAADWDEGERLPVELGKDTMTLSNFVSTGDGVFTESDMGELNYEFTATTNNTLTFTATSKFGTEYEIVMIDVASGIPTTAMAVEKTATVSYLNDEMKTVDTYEIAAPAGDGSYRLDLIIKVSQGEDKSIISFTKLWGGYADLLYLADDGTLQIGRWGNEITKDNYLSKMPFFKFGGVVGAVPSTAITGDEPFELSWVEFNPSNVAVTDLESIPSYTYAGDHEALGIRNVSVNAYHNLSNVLAGKGDPCRLVGMTAAQIAAMSNDNELYAAEQGWRLPTARENVSFVGGTMSGDDSKWLTWVPESSLSEYNGYNLLNSTYSYWTANGMSIDDPGISNFPVLSNYNAKGSQAIPAMGMVNPDGSLYGVGQGFYNSGTAHIYGESNGPVYCLYMGEYAVVPTIYSEYFSMQSVRCVRLPK